MNSSEIRQAFFDYFAARNHQIVPSSSLVPQNDPSLLFTNAGMVQFKNTFLGIESRPYARAVSAQRCLRAGGKHNDLENVGYTARHHTFFEMLGNFSFGDYFKREAIQYAWEFLTKILQLPPERLWVTVYEEDDEAADIWLKEIGVSAKRFSRCGEKDNFWSMGDTGPCGPCTEIFYDHGPNIAGGPPGTEDAEGDRYIEIWNLVFMQFNRDKEGQLHPLPHPSVDTGMGLERIAAVVQGVHSNYEIDSFQHIIRAIHRLVPKVSLADNSLRVLADHIRACSFLIADGILPSNEGRGYVLRRIIRRAVRHGNKLGMNTPFFSRLVQPLIEVMGKAYPEIVTNQSQIEQVLLQEENQFARTLEHGLRLLQEQIDSLAGKVITGEVAFKLYDTYGFPLDLTTDIAREQGLKLDIEGFNACMQEQRQVSQSASQFTSDYAGFASVSEASSFHGYEQDSMSAKVIGLLAEGKKVKKITSGKAGVILENTPFYAESGGQVGDRGQLFSKEGRFCVEDTQQLDKAIVHFGELVNGELRLNQQVTAQVDARRRDAIRLNHTATHLLHAALKQVLGKHVEQKGSLVGAERARFDFSHPEALTLTQLATLEQLVNEKIRANEEAMTELMPISKAKKTGAVALFGEKYGDVVRVLSLGDFSKELCGGTHAKRTGDIGLFKIVEEYGIASGIRRIELMTGAYALNWINQQLNYLQDIATLLKTTPAKGGEKLSQFLHDTKQQEKELIRLQTELAAKSGSDLLAEVETIKGINVLIKQLTNMDSQALRVTLDQLKSSLDNAVILLYTVEDEKINGIAGLSKNLLGQMPSAATLMQELCGKGGGREDMAQGGGQVPKNLSARIEKIKAIIAEHAN